MSKDQYKACLTSVPEDNTKAKCKLCSKTFSLSNMGNQALKSHGAGKKHITVMTQTQKTDSVTDFFTVKCGATPGASSSASLGEPSTALVCETEDTKIPMTKFALRKEQYKAEIFWALKCDMSHFLFQLVSTDITDIFKAMCPGSAIAQKWSLGPTSYLTWSVLALHHTLSNSYLWNLKKHNVLSSHLMSHLTINFKKNGLTSL